VPVHSFPSIFLYVPICCNNFYSSNSNFHHTVAEWLLIGLCIDLYQLSSIFLANKPGLEKNLKLKFKFSEKVCLACIIHCFPGLQ
jgi:hypothetical protein